MRTIAQGHQSRKQLLTRRLLTSQLGKNTGKPTDDPSKALEGVMLPMGGPKGSGLAIMMDVFSGVLTGMDRSTPTPF